MRGAQFRGTAWGFAYTDPQDPTCVSPNVLQTCGLSPEQRRVLGALSYAQRRCARSLGDMRSSSLWVVMLRRRLRSHCPTAAQSRSGFTRNAGLAPRVICRKPLVWCHTAVVSASEQHTGSCGEQSMPAPGTDSFCCVPNHCTQARGHSQGDSQPRA